MYPGTPAKSRHESGAVRGNGGDFDRSRGRPDMPIDWKHDLDEQLDRADGSGTPVLLDFSAAPM